MLTGSEQAGGASAVAAKERLQVMIASKKLHDNTDLREMQRELLAVVDVSPNQSQLLVVLNDGGRAEILQGRCNRCECHRCRPVLFSL